MTHTSSPRRDRNTAYGAASPERDRFTTVSFLNSSIVNKLTAYYGLEESSGTRNSSKGSYSLGASGVVGSTAGKLGDAAVFNPPSSLFSYDSVFSIGSDNFCFFGWFRIAAKTTYGGIISKWNANGTADSDAYIIYHNRDTDKLDVFIRNGSGTAFGFSVDSPAIDTWAFFVWEIDQVNKLLKFRLNNGSATSTSFTGFVSSNSAPFVLGAYNIIAGASLTSFNGALDAIGYCKGSLLTDEEQSYLWNSGIGISLIF